jgi:DNA invertase Pin-like site-specific DNA recombinase
MSFKSNGLQLTGTGAAYLRVSTDKQDTERQIQSVHLFEEQFDVKVARRFWSEDSGVGGVTRIGNVRSLTGYSLSLNRGK